MAAVQLIILSLNTHVPRVVFWSFERGWGFVDPCVKVFTVAAGGDLRDRRVYRRLEDGYDINIGNMGTWEHVKYIGFQP